MEATAILQFTVLTIQDQFVPLPVRRDGAMKPNVGLQNFIDGTSNTILFDESDSATAFLVQIASTMMF
jgi:hypothetical protein